jgi:hypothetical protein
VRCVSVRGSPPPLSRSAMYFPHPSAGLSARPRPSKARSPSRPATLRSSRSRCVRLLIRIAVCRCFVALVLPPS